MSPPGSSRRVPIWVDDTPDPETSAPAPPALAPPATHVIAPVTDEHGSVTLTRARSSASSSGGVFRARIGTQETARAPDRVVRRNNITCSRIKESSRIKKSSRIKEIDGLRAVAVLMVLAYHFDLHLRGGFLGVDLFFAISGFVITRMLFTSIGSPASTCDILKEFYLRRAWRLLPALLATVAVTTITATVFRCGPLSQVVGGAFAGVSGFANWWFGSLSPTRPLHPLSHTWSLAIEEQFYLALPPLLLLFRQHAKRVAGIFATALLALGVRSLLTTANTPTGINASYFSSFARATPIALGVLLATILHVGGKHSTTNALIKRPVLTLGALAAMLTTPVFFADYNSRWLYLGGFVATSIALTGVLAIVIQLAGTDNALAKMLRGRPAQFIGERSYALYLTHFPIALRFDSFGRPVALLLKIALTTLTTEILHQLVEKRFRNYGSTCNAKIGPIAQTSCVVVGSFVAFVIGFGH